MNKLSHDYLINKKTIFSSYTRLQQQEISKELLHNELHLLLGYQIIENHLGKLGLLLKKLQLLQLHRYKSKKEFLVFSPFSHHFAIHINLINFFGGFN